MVSRPFGMAKTCFKGLKTVIPFASRRSIAESAIGVRLTTTALPFFNVLVVLVFLPESVSTSVW